MDIVDGFRVGTGKLFPLSPINNNRSQRCCPFAVGEGGVGGGEGKKEYFLFISNPQPSSSETCFSRFIIILVLYAI